MSNRDDTGVKRVTAQNWMEPDEAAVIWRQMTSVAKTEAEWAEFFLRPTLGPKVPVEIARLLEVARSAMMQSWYYYPLATLGMDQCLRIMETGVRLRCDSLGLSTKSTTKNGKVIEKTFKEIIEALDTLGCHSFLTQFIIPSQGAINCRSWASARHPAFTCGDFERNVLLIGVNKLYLSQSDSVPAGGTGENHVKS